MKSTGLARAPVTRQGLADIREAEQQRLARELHDGPAQALAAALFGVDLALAALVREPARARAELLNARESVREALDDVRDMMTGLRPRLLEERGLRVALHSLAGMPALWGPEVTIETRGLATGDRLPADVELALFRVAQEAVSNARRHGAASHVRVLLEVGANIVTLTVVDDGRGFTLPAPRGNGLAGIRERAALLAGELTIASTPGTGTRIAVALPLPEAAADRMEGTA
jgi:two-component system sensor histidine kinase DegS